MIIIATPDTCDEIFFSVLFYYLLCDFKEVMLLWCIWEGVLTKLYDHIIRALITFFDKKSN